MSRVIELENEIKEIENRKTELQKELEIEKQRNEIEYPFEYNEEYWLVTTKGTIRADEWVNHNIDIKYYYKQGNIFKTKVEAEKESDRRELMTRFRQFRDKCNGDWKPDWDNVLQDKFHISYIYKFRRLDVFSECRTTKFSLFGYFKNQADCFSAIGLFGDEIKRLFLEAEYE